MMKIGDSEVTERAKSVEVQCSEEYSACKGVVQIAEMDNPLVFGVRQMGIEFFSDITAYQDVACHHLQLQLQVRGRFGAVLQSVRQSKIYSTTQFIQ
jgi:hypothetical protein